MSDISDHYSRFALFHSPREKTHLKKRKIRDYSHFVQDAFNMELLQIDWKTSRSVDESFVQFYNKLNKLINKHAPLKTISRQQATQFARPWITSGLRKSIKVKNSLFRSGDTANYKQCRNKISSLTRLSKKLYYQVFFEANLNNMKKTWIILLSYSHLERRESHRVCPDRNNEHVGPNRCLSFQVKTHESHSSL